MVLFYLLCSQALAYPRGSLEARFIQAAGKNDITTMNALLQQGIQVNELRADALAQLVRIRKINKDTLGLLIEKGLDVSDGQLLHHVRNLDSTRVLLDAGANINAIRGGGEYGYTPLHRLIAPSGYNNPLPVDYVSMVKLLLERGADPNAMSGSGTPLHLASAVKPGTEDVIELLVQHGADVNATITFEGHHGRDPNLRLTDYTPIMRAVYYRDIKKISLLLEHGADAQKAPNGCDTFCMLHRVKTKVLNTPGFKPADIEKSKQRFAKLEVLLLQYYPDVVLEEVIVEDHKTGSKAVDLLITTIAENKITDLQYTVTIIVFIIATLLYTTLLSWFMKTQFIRGVFFALLLIPVEFFIADWAANKALKGIDLAYAGGGAIGVVIVAVIIGIIAGLVAMLFLVPLVLSKFCRKKTMQAN